MRLALAVATVLCGVLVNPAWAEGPRFAVQKKVLRKRRLTIDPGDDALKREDVRRDGYTFTQWSSTSTNAESEPGRRKIVARLRHLRSYPERWTDDGVEAEISGKPLWSARILEQRGNRVWIQIGSPAGFREQVFSGDDALERAILAANQHLDEAERQDRASARVAR
jgi:hypothetical protein